MGNVTVTDPKEELALALKSMEIHQLQSLQHETAGQRDHFITVAQAAINLNKVLLQKLYNLEHATIHAKGLADASEKVTDVRLFASNQMEKVQNEWDVACNGERSTNDPRKVGTKPGLFVGDTTVSEYLGFNRDGHR
ncbi:hypothetical protein STRATTON_145 [Erwinia phage vB_EamM_Stratton]|uniref:Uncharacterized protein n=1 Tax=Erwinia phage vB_EamM_Stratton TaxID=1883378 RepID=A0A1B2IH22_9CAUD|nr:hypothetical protein STRATTON_145 [Erwinia phage vB_EamM_Stratton]